MRAAGILVGSAVALGCASRGPVRYVTVTPPTAQARSFLGDTLWNLPIEPAEGQKRVELLFRARARHQEKPYDVDAYITLGRRTEALGRFREAIAIYTEAMAESDRFHDPRLPRRRGEALLRIRELDLALEDLRRAARGAVEQSRAPELNEPHDGGGFLVTSLQFSAFFYLGIAHYLQGDFVTARSVLIEAAEHAQQEDEFAQIAFWLFCTTRRLGRIEEAAKVLEAIPAGMSTGMAGPELDMILAFRGDLPQDSLPVGPSTVLRSPQDAVYGYGIGFALLILDRVPEAELMFQKVRTTSNWATLPYLAAEAELARLRRAKEDWP